MTERSSVFRRSDGTTRPSRSASSSLSGFASDECGPSSMKVVVPASISFAAAGAKSTDSRTLAAQ
jgi:hypothetical protein